mmetsp:Transcript_6638/g.19630  ORF Transcript_6638/g.19630 Transcript_6638/m.19630 type:complete len:232 (-) Transcript_6638:739-1434(-)
MSPDELEDAVRSAESSAASVRPPTYADASLAFYLAGACSDMRSRRGAELCERLLGAWIEWGGRGGGGGSLPLAVVVPVAVAIAVPPDQCDGRTRPHGQTQIVQYRFARSGGESEADRPKVQRSVHTLGLRSSARRRIDDVSRKERPHTLRLSPLLDVVVPSSSSANESSPNDTTAGRPPGPRQSDHHLLRVGTLAPFQRDRGGIAPFPRLPYRVEHGGHLGCTLRREGYSQ